MIVTENERQMAAYLTYPSTENIMTGEENLLDRVGRLSDHSSMSDIMHFDDYK